MKLTIIGTGYVGLVTGTCFAEVGHQVVCVDNDAAKVKVLQEGGIPIYEPGLEELVRKNVGAGRLSFTVSTAEGVEKSDIVFIAVPTPPQPDGSVDLSFIEKVAREIAAAMTSYKIVVDKSTVPVRTGDKVAETIKRYCKARVDFDVEVHACLAVALDGLGYLVAGLDRDGALVDDDLIAGHGGGDLASDLFDEA